jgi:UDP-N-acetylglucosamine 1-carboxyvinyltransferase
MRNCAREPEVADLADLLNKMGAQVEGAGTSTIRVKGVSKLHGAKHRIIPDRIESATFIIAGAMTGGDLNIAGCDPAHLCALLEKLADVGVKTRLTADSVRVMGDVPIKAADIVTEEYPGFPTDMQAQYMALATQAEGTSIITENIFENRFMHALEMVRMGANIKIEGRRAVVRGPSPLSAAAVLASDLRASASLVLAALVAEGESIIDRVSHRPVITKTSKRNCAAWEHRFAASERSCPSARRPRRECRRERHRSCFTPPDENARAERRR